jgi:hypothetical protein
MSKFYIQDSTIGRYVIFDSVPQVVSYLGSMIPRAFNMSRDQYVQNLLDLGYGYDDAGGITLTRAMAEQFNIGIVKDGNYVRTDIHEAISYQGEEFGTNAGNRFEDRGRV